MASLVVSISKSHSEGPKQNVNEKAWKTCALGCYQLLSYQQGLSVGLLSLYSIFGWSIRPLVSFDFCECIYCAGALQRREELFKYEGPSYLYRNRAAPITNSESFYNNVGFGKEI